MKTYILLIVFSIFAASSIIGQEYATFNLTGIHQGDGTFNNAILSDFEWLVEGTLASEVQILDDEVFDDGNELENIFGQADNAQNLRIKIVENGAGTSGQTISSQAILTIDFDEVTPSNGWGFCLVDIDVENALISAIDQENNVVPHDIIDDWLIELFDADLIENGINLPKWDPINSALLGSDTPASYTVYNNLVIGGMPSSEAPAAFFMPDIPLKSLIIGLENLQEEYSVSYHFYLASLNNTRILENPKLDFYIYPNPSKGKFEIRNLLTRMAGLSPGNEHCRIELFDLFGKSVALLYEGKSGSEFLEFDVSNLANGVYNCRILVGKYMQTNKIVIAR